MEIKITTDEEFQKTILSHKKVMVKFYAEWCGVCRRFAPIYKKLSINPKYKDIHFIEVPAEKTPKARLAAGVYGLPYFATFEEGKLADKVNSGNKDDVVKLLDDLIAAEVA